MGRRPKLRRTHVRHAPVVPPPVAARAAGLRYVSDERPGIRRLRAGRGFRYVGPDGRPVRDEVTLARIRRLAIPPAYTQVWICPLEEGHLQATARDARGRKQYRYHPRWREVRDETKYDRVVAFGYALPRIRARVEGDLSLPGLPRPKVLATILRLLETTLVRVGNDEYARTNDSYGLTTFHDQHVTVHGAHLRFAFRGKSGKEHVVAVTDRRLARTVQRCQDLPGEELFQFIDHEGARHSVDSGDVNDYLREVSGEELTAKDFRTWGGTVLMARALAQLHSEGGEPTQRATKRRLVEAIKRVAERLGNTAAVCRKAYIHPEVIALYQAGALIETLTHASGRRATIVGLSAEETAVLTLLEERRPSLTAALEASVAAATGSTTAPAHR